MLKLDIIKQVTTDTFLQFIWKNEQGNQLKVDVVKDIPRHFGEMKMHGKIRLDSLENIGSNKILAILVEKIENLIFITPVKMI